MRRHDARSSALLAVTLSLLAFSVFAFSLLAFSLTPAGAAAPRSPRTVVASVGSAPTGQLMAPGFVGLSVEYTGLQQYAGRDPRAVNPVFVQLLRNLAPAQHPILRIGGDSTDSTWWPVRGMRAPAGVSYALTRGWFESARALASAANARLILGVNLAANRPMLAAAEGRALLEGVGRRYVEALEIGNEPDAYNVFPYYYEKQGRPVYARGQRYGLKAYTHEFSRWSSVLPRIGEAGPALAELAWLPGLAKFIRAEPRLRVITLHRYPLRAGAPSSSSEYPSIKNLLSDRSSSALAQEVAPSVATAHAHGLPLRVDEMNSASHFGQPGLSNTFASALWVLDTLFNLASVGTDGVNIHSRTDAAYGLFTVSHRRRGWKASIRPEYYGMLMFEQAFPPGARLLGVSAPAGPLKVWATRAEDGHTRVVMINKDTSSAYQVQLQVAGAGTGTHATLDWLRAPSVRATGGVSLGGQTFGHQTTTGRLPGPPHTDSVTSSGGSYTVELPAASSVLLTQ